MVKEIPLQNGMVALVDDEDYEDINQFNWHVVNRKNTIEITSNKAIKDNSRVFSLAVFIKGKIDKGKVYFHKNRNLLDFKKDNLIALSPVTINQMLGPQNNSSTRYKGVYKQTRTYKGKEYIYYQVAITVGERRFYLGSFKNEDDAARKYNEQACVLIGKHAYRNIIGVDNRIGKVNVGYKGTNQKRSHKNKTSQYLGVSYHKQHEKWYVSFAGLFLGLYNSEVEAAKSYDKKVKVLHGVKAILNFPEEVDVS